MRRLIVVLTLAFCNVRFCWQPVEAPDCDPMPYGIEDRSYRFCSTGFLHAGTSTLDLKFDCRSVEMGCSVDSGDVHCLLSGLKVDVSVERSAGLRRRGCAVYFDNSEWIAVVDDHTQCAFMCIWHYENLCDKNDDLHKCIAHRELQNTANSLDVTFVRERLFSTTTPESDSDSKSYRSFCGLSGYNMALFQGQTSSLRRESTDLNGYCQLYADREMWKGAAWKGAIQDPDLDCHSSCDVTCYDQIDHGIRRQNTVEYNGLMFSHAIHRTKGLDVSFDGDTQCSLSYINVQPDSSTLSNPDLNFVGCELNTTEMLDEWKINIFNSDVSHNVVECGVVCTCALNSKELGGPYQCIPGIDKQENLVFLSTAAIGSYSKLLSKGFLLGFFSGLFSVTLLFLWQRNRQ